MPAKMNSPDPKTGTLSAVGEKLNIDAELLPFFKEEAAEIFTNLEKTLVAWEANPGDKTATKTIYRMFHTLKGSANSIGLSPIGRLSHSMEQIMKSVSEERSHPSPHALVPAIRTISTGLQILLQELSPDSCCPRLFAELESKVGVIRNGLLP